MTKNKSAIYIISTPRSGSTLMMRVLAKALGSETKIYSEPGVANFALTQDLNWVPHLNQIEADLKTFEGVDHRIIEEIKQNSVVIKDMIHTVYDHLISGQSALIKNKGVRYIFLVRNPHATLVSLGKIMGQLPMRPPGLVSYQKLYDLYQYLKENSINKPVVIDVDKFFSTFPNKLDLLFNLIEVPLTVNLKKTSISNLLA